MKRIVFTTALVLTALTAGLLCTVLIAIRLDVVHQMVISRVNSIIPGSFSLGRLELSPLGVKVTIRDMTLADATGKGLAGFDQLTIEASLPSFLLKKTIVIRQAVVQNPWAVLESDSSGRLLLLKAFPQTDPKPKDTTLALATPPPIVIRNLSIVDGGIVVATHRESIDLKVFGLALTAHGETGTMSGEALLTLDSAVAALKQQHINLRDLALLVRVRNMDIDTLNLSLLTASSSLHLTARACSLATRPQVHLSLEAALSLDELGGIAGTKDQLRGSAAVQLDIMGAATNPDLAFDVRGHDMNIFGSAIDSLTVSARMHDRTLRLAPLAVRSPMGSVDITGQINARDLFTKGFLSPPGSLQDIEYDISISASSVLLNLIDPQLEGRADASVTLAGRGADPDSLRAQLLVETTVNALRFDTSSQPIDISVSCSASVERSVARIHRLASSSGGASLSLTGTYGISSGSVDAQANISLPDLASLPGVSGLDLSGEAFIAAKVGGNTTKPEAALKLRADGVRVGSNRIGAVELDAKMTGDGTATIDDLTIANESSQLRLFGWAGVLENGRPKSAQKVPFDLTVTSESLKVSDFIDSVIATVSIDSRIHGTFDNLQGHLRLSAQDLWAASQQIGSIDLDAHIEGQRAYIQPFRITLAPGQALTLSGWASLNDSFQIELSAPEIDLATLPALAAVDSLRGLLSLNVLAQGTYRAPSALGELRITGVGKGSLPIEDISLRVGLHNGLAEVSGNALANINARYNLTTADFDVDLACTDLDLTPYLALSGQDLQGSISFSARASGNADSLAALVGELTIGHVMLNHHETAIMEANDVHVKVEGNRYVLGDFGMKLAREGALSGRASGQFNGHHDALISGILPLTMVRPFLAEIPDIEGTVTIDASFNGTPAQPQLRAAVEFKDIGMTVPGISQRLHSLKGNLRANTSAIHIEGMRGNLGSGTFEVSGELSLDNDLTPSGVRAQVNARTLPVSVPGTLDLLLDATVQLAGTPDTTRVSGDISILDGLYYQDVVIAPLSAIGQRRRKENPTSTQEDKTPFIKNMNFDLGVNARSPLRVSNNLANLTIRPDLQLMGRLQSPSLNGRATVEEGSITYRKRVFTVERGIIDFVNPYRIEPRIDILGTVPVQQWTISIEITGPPDDLAFKLSGDSPSLTDEDLLSLLVLGRRSSKDQGQAAQSQQQMLASLVASTFGDDIRKATGLDMLEVETGDDLNQKSDRIAVTMGKQLTKRLGVKYTMESDTRNAFQRATAEYRILQNLRVVGFQDTRDIFGGELRLTWERR